MRIRKPGKILDNLWFLGRNESCLYLLEGRDSSIIISGGMSYVTHDFVIQIKSFNIDESKIKKMLILHAHFDHIGIVPYLKRKIPDIEIFASKRAWELLSMNKVINTVNEFALEVAKSKGRESVYNDYDLNWSNEINGKIVTEGDHIDLGDLGLDIYETPGHSSCAISAYSPTIKALFASDSGGIPYKTILVTSGNSNFTEYQKSLEKLKDLEINHALRLLIKAQGQVQNHLQLKGESKPHCCPAYDHKVISQI